MFYHWQQDKIEKKEEIEYLGTLASNPEIIKWLQRQRNAKVITEGEEELEEERSEEINENNVVVEE